MSRVFIYSTRSLFSQGIKTLLDAEPELDVIGWETDAEEAAGRIEQMKPDAILVITRDSSSGLSSDEQLFLRAGGKVKIIELNVENSNVRVYCGEQLTITEVGELVNAIEEPVTEFWKRISSAEHDPAIRESRQHPDDPTTPR